MKQLNLKSFNNSIHPSTISIAPLCADMFYSSIFRTDMKLSTTSSVICARAVWNLVTCIKHERVLRMRWKVEGEAETDGQKIEEEIWC